MSEASRSGKADARLPALTRLHGQVEERAATGALTGVWNRRRMEELLEREAERCHLQGDAVLKAVADVLRTGTRSIDIAARWAGDEFALATLPDSAFDGELLLEAADMALPRAKRAGKDQIRSAPRSRFGRARSPRRLREAVAETGRGGAASADSAGITYGRHLLS